MAVNKDTGDTRTFTFDMFRILPQPNLLGSWVQDTLGWDYGVVAITSIIEADLYDYDWGNAGAGPQVDSIDTNVQHSPGVWMYPVDAESFASFPWASDKIVITNTDSAASSFETLVNAAP